MKFAVIGGDARQKALARLMRDDGHWVKTAALGEEPGAVCLRRIAGAMEDAEYVILPLPAGVSGGALNAPMEQETVSLGDVVQLIRPEQRILAGKPDSRLLKLCCESNVRVDDYFSREELTVKNAAITAEGAVGLLMEELQSTLLGARILIAGFGRIGKLLSLRLKAIGADVTASARRWEDFAWIEAFGLHGVDTRDLSGKLGPYNIIINTVPAQIFDAALLRELPSGCLVVDLASAPGGVDAAVAERMGVRCIRALGLPGKTAPESAGAAVRDAIYHMIKDWECAN